MLIRLNVLANFSHAECNPGCRTDVKSERCVGQPKASADISCSQARLPQWERLTIQRSNDLQSEV